MADQNKNRPMGNRQDQYPQTRTEDESGEPEVYYEYSYAEGYYDPLTGEWIEEYFGPFTGVGPGNYQRSDERISEDVCDLYYVNGQLDARDIDVHVENGEVTLTGSAPDRRMKRLAEDLAFGIPGVVDVNNQLKIPRPQGQAGPQPQPTPEAEPARSGAQQSRKGARESAPFDREQNPESRQAEKKTSSPEGRGLEWKSQLKPGQVVMSSDGKRLGTVKDIFEHEFMLNRRLDVDERVPFYAIKNVDNNQVHMAVTYSHASNLEWSAAEKQASSAH
ncbi:MAG: BON domain-containing protein [Rudaea sp.]